jgi:hypothetical protein
MNKIVILVRNNATHLCTCAIMAQHADPDVADTIKELLDAFMIVRTGIVKEKDAITASILFTHGLQKMLIHYYFPQVVMDTLTAMRDDVTADGPPSKYAMINYLWIIHYEWLTADEELDKWMHRHE